MSLVCVTSAHGSPGATTLALLMAGCWPRPVVVIEADPSGGVLAVRYGLGRSPGLADLAAAVDTHAPPAAIWSAAQSLPGGLRVVVAPESGDVSVRILDDVAVGMARWCHRLDEVDVVVDCGRVFAASPANALMSAADSVLVVSRAMAEQLYPAAHRVHSLNPVDRSGLVGLVLVGTRPHGPEEVSARLDVPVLGVIDHDEPTARLLSNGGAPRSLRRSALVRSVSALVDSLAHRLGASDAAVSPAAHLRSNGRRSRTGRLSSGGL